MPSLQMDFQRCRNRRSVKKREQKRSREQQQQQEDHEEDKERAEGRHGTRHQVEEGYMSREEDNLDNTTARITSLLQRIEGEESRAEDGKYKTSNM